MSRVLGTGVALVVSLMALAHCGSSGSGGAASGSDAASDAGSDVGSNGSDAAPANDASMPDSFGPETSPDAPSTSTDATSSDVTNVMATDAPTDVACGACFTQGDWAIANLEPCFLTYTNSSNQMVTSAYASTPGNPETCAFDMNTGMPTVPATWSTDTLEADCAGTYSLCYTLKAGDPKNPQASDCTVGQSCTAATAYAPAGTTMTFAPLPGWQSMASAEACVNQFQSTGGYGEMSVSGTPDGCGALARVLGRVTYCPTDCSGPSPPPACNGCVNGGSGDF
jgi:hypothetical protein